MKVPMWTWDVSLETFLKQLQIWQNSYTDVPVNTQINKEVKGLAKHVGEHILPIITIQECQTVR